MRLKRSALEEVLTSGSIVKRKSVELGRGRAFQKEESTVIQDHPSCKQLKLPFDGRGRVLLADNSRKGLVSTETVVSRRSPSKTRKFVIKRVDKGCCK